MSKSIRSTTQHFEKQKIARFRRLDTDHSLAIESLFNKYPFLHNRAEIHMPFSRAKSTFSSGTLWLWPKFDKRPVGYLIFLDGFAPCIWYPVRQEGMTFRWLLPPNFTNGTVCLANILAGESLLQIEDIVVHEGKDLWSSMTFSERWIKLRDFWRSLPSDQPHLAFKPQIVTPVKLSDWSLHYNPAIYWIIQPDHVKQPRWYWKDTVDQIKVKEYIAPKLKRDKEIISVLCALCKPYKLSLPDTYSIFSQENENLGVVSISSLQLSTELRKAIKPDGIPVEVTWKEDFNKYQIMRIMPDNTPITTNSFFYHSLKS